MARQTDDEHRLLEKIAAGATLKAHRTLDGLKEYRLRKLGGGIENVDAGSVEGLLRRGFVESNMKFPAATYLLTDRGLQAFESLGLADSLPLTSRR